MNEIKIEKYSSYKDSKAEWIGEIPMHWEVKKIKFIAEIQKGKLPSKIVSSNETNLPPYMSMEYLRGGEENQWVLDKNSKIINENETLLLWDGSNAGEFIKSRKGIISSTIAQISFYNIDSRFAWHYSKSIEVELKGKTIGMGIPHVNGSELKNSIAPIPPLSEQTAIANFLDRKTALIDQAVDIKQKQIELLKERRQILIHKAVTRGLNPDAKLKDSGVEWIGKIPEGWEVKRLKDVCCVNLNSLPENTNNNFEFNYVDIGSVTLESGINNIENFSFKSAPSRARRIVKKGDTIISTVRTYLKAIDFIDEVKSSYIYSTGFAVLEPKEFVFPEFLAYFVRSDAFTEQVTVNSKGMSYPAINSNDMSRLTVVHCGFDEQIQIVKYIETATAKIATAISLKQQEIEKLKEYKATLINSAVTGKIKISNYAK